MKDLYYEKNYGRLYEDIENGVCEIFEFKHCLGTVYHLFIKKEIPITISKCPYYDIVTPYGYGGPIITECDSGRKEELIEFFSEAFKNFCLENQIVTEVVRFHPILNNASDFRNYYKLIHRRNTTGTNLSAFEDPIQKEFSKSCRRNIKKALKDGVEYRVTVNPKQLNNFKEIYYATMKRNNADSIYYFDDKYFSNCLKYFGENLILTEAIFEEKVIGMGLSFFYNDLIHTHLSGTDSEYNHLSPSYILQYAIALWGKENGKTLIHDGGGRSAEPDDNLFLFKKQFGKNTEFKYFMGTKIWNEKVYNNLCLQAGVDPNSNVFPAYQGKK